MKGYVGAGPFEQPIRNLQLTITITFRCSPFRPVNTVGIPREAAELENSSKIANLSGVARPVTLLNNASSFTSDFAT